MLESFVIFAKSFLYVENFWNLNENFQYGRNFANNKTAYLHAEASALCR